MSKKPERPLWESARGWRLWQKPLAAGLILVAVVSLLLVPSVSSWLEARTQARMLDRYADLVEGASVSRLEQLRADAHKINQELVPHAYLFPGVMAPLAQSYPDDLEIAQAELPPLFAGPNTYLEQLNLGDGIMSRLYFPAAGIDAPVLHWVNESSLSSGVGQVPSSSLPVGGEGTMTVLVGSAQAGFNGLTKVETGHVLMLQTLGQDLFYRLEEIYLLEVGESDTFEAVGNADRLILVSSPGTDSLAERIVVTLARDDAGDLDADFSAPAGPSSSPGFPLWLLALVLTVALSAFLVWYSGRPLKEEEKRQLPQEPKGEPESVAKARKAGVLPVEFEKSQDFLDYVGEYVPDPRSLAEQDPDDSSYPAARDRG